MPPTIALDVSFCNHIGYDRAMGRWEPDARGRLEQAAMELFEERGLEFHWVGDEVVGFYPLVVAQVVRRRAATSRKGVAKHPIPLMLLARLAVATSWQGQGLGSGLLKDAMLRALQAAHIAGIREITCAVYAKDDDARAFYERFGLVAAPTEPYHLFVL